MKIRIERTANPSGVEHFNYCAVVDGMEEQHVSCHGDRPIQATINLFKAIRDCEYPNIDPDAVMAEGITIEGQAQ